MRICLVSCEHPPFFGGGIGTYTSSLSRALAAAGHDVQVITNAWTDYAEPGPRAPSGTEVLPNLRVHRIDAFTRDYTPRPPYDQPGNPLGHVCRSWVGALYWSILVAEKLDAVHREHPVQVVEFPESFADGYIALRRRGLGLDGFQLPMTVTLHAPIYETQRYNCYETTEPWYQRRTVMEDYCIRHADTLACPSRCLGEMITERLRLDSAERPVAVIRNPVDHETLDRERDAVTPESEDSPSLLFVGRLEPRKGVKYLVDAAVKVMPDYPALTVHFLGRNREAGEAPGSMIQFLRRRIPEPLQSRFVFHGHVPRRRVLARYASAAACVFPAPWDNFPYTCCEAMAAGACVIASDRGGMAEMIEHERSGLRFRSCDVDSLAAAIRRALDEPELAAELRAGGSRRIRDLCDPQVVVPQRIAHYENTIERYGQRGPRNAAAAPSAATVALLLRKPGPEADVRRSIESVRRSASRAGIDLDLSVVGPAPAPSQGAALQEMNVIEAPDDGEEAAALAPWLARLDTLKPDYLLTLSPAETVGEDFLTLTTRLLAGEPTAAWATTWAKARDGDPGECYVGFDFSVPLELVYHHPVPFAVIRRRAFDEVGGWNLELPAGWRQWDLWLAFHQAGWRGLVAPVWQGEYDPDPAMRLKPPWHHNTCEMILEAIGRRNRQLLGEHVTPLWVSLVTNHSAVRIFPDISKSLGVWSALRLLRRVISRSIRERIAALRKKLSR